MTTHNHLTTLASRIGLAVVLGLFSMAPAMADKMYDNWDFKGEYKVSLIDADMITEDGYMGMIEYCTAVATVVADGAGSMEFTGTSRCNLERTVKIEEISGVMWYDVLPNGEVLFYEDPLSDPPVPSLHGVLVNHGNTVLLDGTAGSDNMLFQQGSIVKQLGDKGANN